CGATTANAKSFTYCSLHENGGFITTAALAAFNCTYSNNVQWFNSGQGITINAPIANNDWTFDNNLVMRAASYGFLLTDMGGVCTNNTVCGCASQYAYYLGESATTLGTFSNNTAHSTQGGLNAAVAGMQGVVSNFTAWRVNAAS